MFDAALYLGVCDKIVPGLLIGALRLRPPAGDVRAGRADDARAFPTSRRPRCASAMPPARPRARNCWTPKPRPTTRAGTCTFYGTANSNQMLLEAMGLQLPGTSFVNPGTPLRDALTARRHRARAAHHRAGRRLPSARPADRRTRHRQRHGRADGHRRFHQPHHPLVAVARAAGIVLTWDDMDELSRSCRCWPACIPNGDADVNHFAAAGGTAVRVPRTDRCRPAAWRHRRPSSPAACVRYARSRGCATAAGLRDPAREQRRRGRGAAGRRRRSSRKAACACCDGNLGRADVKMSAVKPEHRRIEAPAVVIDDPQALNKLHAAGVLPQRFRRRGALPGPARQRHAGTAFAGPAAGHAAGPGRRVALLTDGRLSGASGKVLAAIHLTSNT